MISKDLKNIEAINNGLTIKVVKHFKPNCTVQFTASYDDFDASIFDASGQLSSILETKVRSMSSAQCNPPAMIIDESKVDRLQYWSERLEVPSFISQFYLGDRISFTFKLTDSSGELVRELELVEKKAAPHFGDNYKVEKKLYLLPFSQSVEWRF